MDDSRAKLIGVAEVAKRLGVSRSLVYEMVRRGDCPIEPIRLGVRLIRFRELEVDRFIAGGPSTDIH